MEIGRGTEKDRQIDRQRRSRTDRPRHRVTEKQKQTERDRQTETTVKNRPKQTHAEFNRKRWMHPGPEKVVAAVLVGGDG